MEVERKIRKVGNSLGVVLPSDMIKALGVKNGDSIYISMENEGEVIFRTESGKTENDEFKQKVIAIIEEYMNNEESK